jgi:hypothetical protein
MVQFRPCAILQYSKTPSLRSPGFEDDDDDDDEDENEAPQEWRPTGLWLEAYTSFKQAKTEPLGLVSHFGQSCEHRYSRLY